MQLHRGEIDVLSACPPGPFDTAGRIGHHQSVTHGVIKDAGQHRVGSVNDHRPTLGADLGNPRLHVAVADISDARSRTTPIMYVLTSTTF
jgi:hypothetical protein